MKKLVTLISLFVLVLAGCGSSTDSESANVATFVTDTGGINDKSFNQGTWEGIQKYAEDNDVEVSYIETQDQSQTEQNLNAAAAKSDLVIAAGFTASNALYKAALSNPDTNFVLIDSEPADENGNSMELDNVHSYLFNEHEAGYLVGYVAGKTTETNVVGYIGGMKTPPVQRFGLGYVQGVQAANPDCEVLYNYSGSFENVSLGKTSAEAMYSQDADIIFTAAGGVNTGVIEAAKEQRQSGNEAWVIGVDRDMYADGVYNDEGDSVILTSAVKQVGEAAYEALTLQFETGFEAGTESLGYQDGGVGLPEENPNLDQEVVDEALSSLDGADVKSTVEETEEILDITVSGEL